MTRYAQLIQAVDAVRATRAPTSAPPEPDLMRFVVFEDNGGGYRWTIVASGGETLVLSASFASDEDARAAAHAVHAGAASASFEQCPSDTPPADLATHRDKRRARDHLDAARWLDEGGSFSSEAVTRWRAET